MVDDWTAEIGKNRRGKGEKEGLDIFDLFDYKSKQDRSSRESRWLESVKISSWKERERRIEYFRSFRL